VVQIGQLTYVQEARDGRALRRLVKTGPAHDGRVEILSGLRAGNQIVVNPVREE
jgi:multidrug efflux pump subunit AcrA (membrane-fusion protein)